MSPGPVKVRRATRTAADKQPAGRPRHPAVPPANDNRAPGIVIALLIVAAIAAVFGAVAWLFLA